MPRTSPSDDTISETTSPHPPCRFTSRRNAVSVIPAIGATTYGDCSSTEPIFMTLVGADVGSVDFDAYRLANEIDRQHEPRLLVFPQQTPEHALEWPVHHLDHHALANHRARVVREIAF